MDHYRDLSTYTTTAAESVQAKAVSDAARLTAAEQRGVAIVDSLPVQQRAQLYGWLRDNQ